jgi:hypothetical protein
MNFNLSKAIVSHWKASEDALNQVPLKTGKLGNGPKPHFPREERCLFEKIFHKRAHGSFMNASWGRKDASVYDGLIELTAMPNCFTYNTFRVVRVLHLALSSRRSVSFAELEDVKKKVYAISLCTLLVMIVPTNDCRR